MIIEIDNKDYEIEVIKKHNKNTYIRVKNGKIVITTNYLISKRNIIRLVNDNIKSIKKMIDISLKKEDKKNNFYYFGYEYDIIYGFNNTSIIGNKIYTSNEDVLNKYILKSIKDIYQERLNYWYNIFEEEIPVPNLKIRKMTSRWGVCNIRNHNITLNLELSKYNICCLDYVIVHELSHFIHHNHGEDFWNLVRKYYPEYKKCKKILKEE